MRHDIHPLGDDPDRPQSFVDQWHDPDLYSTWVRRTTRDPGEHTCKPPMRERVFKLTGPGTTQFEHRDSVPDGAWNDLWRCYCGRLWRIGNACDNCDRQGRADGLCTAGWHHVTKTAWRPARWWQRLWHPGRP